jgi:thioredoxin reductase
VTIVTRDEKLSASKVVVEKVEAHPQIEVITSSTPVEVDDFGFITTGMDMQTSAPGIFAAGDVRSGSTKQAASAAGEGAAAALGLRRYLEDKAGTRPHLLMDEGMLVTA